MTRTDIVRTASAIAVVVAACLPSPAPAGERDVDRVHVEANQVGIEYIAHACFRLHAADGTRLLIDPWADRVWIGYDFPEGLEADAVLVTHPHFDHDGGEFMGKEPPWEPDARVIVEPGRYAIGPFRVTGLAGKHADPYGKEFGQKNTIWIVEISGLRIAHLGDNGSLSEANQKALEGIDVLMAPIDDQEHILGHDVITWMQRVLQPKVLIPMHYRHADLECSPDEPDDLGGIGRWLETEKKKRHAVKRLRGHVVTLQKNDLPEHYTILVPRHSPRVKRPESGG